MPNTRRRRFSVQNEIRGRDMLKSQNGTQVNSNQESDIKAILQTPVTIKTNKLKNKICPNTSKKSSNLQIVDQCQSTSNIFGVIDANSPTIDKDVTASSSNIDLFNILGDCTEGIITKKVQDVCNEETKNVFEMKHVSERFPTRRDKHPRQHRIKVRSPKRKPPNIDKHEVMKRSVGVSSIDWTEHETLTLDEIQPDVIVDAEATVDDVQEEERPSTFSMDDMCRICHGGESLSPELGQLISACSCRGTVGRVHVKCLERWLTESGKSRCELCGTRYATRRVHRYGVLRALVMWILSQNAKQLMVDSLGIMLMSPLAVLAAWLSGRTLAGLMTQETHATPWPLASTFVLACMTLVCYYCWIVSAATRHALGWWIWYRSQYEVRLQFAIEE
ncbi:uncharacterized protein LOC119840604 [Zerene cesonia]|uniref:uncharacterized protein LOC119840604 n=1 Tax=Zerene cesonia TaxID=33412 RepID=UPI0018E58AE5|nr:uncharacterized protein LOC119840604 [Zerene cesonia]